MRAPRRLRLHRLDDFPAPVPEQQRAMATVVVDVAVAIDVPLPRPFRPVDVDRVGQRAP